MVMGGIEYRREMNRNYMVIHPEPEWNGAYTIRMLGRNNISGILDFQEKGINGVSQYYYDITSKQPLNRILEHRNMTVKEIQRLLSDFIYALKQMERFLLDEQQIRMEPEYIYIEPDTFRCSFCLIPGYKQDFAASFFVFSQYILDHVDYSDGDAVILAFSIFRAGKQENFGIQDLERCLREKTENSAPSAESEVEQIVEKELWEESEIVEEGVNSAQNLVGKRGVLYVGISGIIVLILVGIMHFFGWHVLVDRRLWFVVVLLVLFMGMFLLGRLQMFSKGLKEGRSASENKEEYQLWDMNLQEEETFIHQFAPLESERENRKRIEEPVETEEDHEFQTVLLTSSVEQKKQMKRRLVAVNGSIDIEISYFPFLVGKSKSMSDFWLNEPGVSRLHVKLEESGGEYMITDLNSTNGTRVNGQLLDANESKRIFPGDELMIAETKFMFR